MSSKAIIGIITTIAIFVGLYFVIANGLKQIENAEKDVAVAYAECVLVGAECEGGKADYEKHKEYANAKVAERAMFYNGAL